LTDAVCLAVDLGTGGPKVGLCTVRGELLASELHAVTTTRGPGGLATQDAEEWWRVIADAARRLLAADPARATRVRAVAVTGQWASTVPVDAAGRPVGPVLQWSDTRGRPYSRRRFGGPVAGYAPRVLYRFVTRNGAAPDLAGADPIGHTLYLMAEEPERYASARWLLEPVDYVTMRFTGVASASHASMQASWLLDTRDLTRLDYDAVLCGLAGIDATKLAPLRPIGSVVAPVRDDVAADLGLPDGVVAVTGLPDLHAAALGTGATRLHDVHLALSTTSWISCPVAKKKTDVFHQQATVPGLTSDSYLIANNQDTGAKCLDWLRSTAMLGASAPLGYEQLCALAADSPPGAGGLLFTPWLAGERSPVGDHGARAGIRGLSLSTTAADLARCVLEGVALNSRWLFGYVERFAKAELGPVHLLGGGAQSALWCQIYADVLGREVVQAADPMYAQLRGMAALAGVALGAHRLDEVGALLPSGRRFEPDAAATAVYDELAPLLATVHARERKTVRTLRRTAAAPPPTGG
jgi:xylulokinase